MILCRIFASQLHQSLLPTSGTEATPQATGPFRHDLKLVVDKTKYVFNDGFIAYWDIYKVMLFKMHMMQKWCMGICIMIVPVDIARTRIYFY